MDLRKLIFLALGAIFGCTCANAVSIPNVLEVAGEGFTNELVRTVDGWTGRGVTVRIAADGVVSVFAPSNRLSWVRMSWRHDWPTGAVCLADAWERSYGDLEWRPIAKERRLSPWYFLVHDGVRTDGYGVEVQPNALACWRIRSCGYDLRLDLRAGSELLRLGNRMLDAVRILERKGEVGESVFQAGRAFCRMMCPCPRLPKEPFYGYNDWYCAYGNNTATNFLEDAAFVSASAKGLTNRPYVVMDDGWQRNSPMEMARSFGGYDSGMGPWDAAGPNFGMDMPTFCRKIAALGARPGLWYRPLRAWPGVSASRRLVNDPNYFDPSLAETRRQIFEEIGRFRNWGFKLVKIDFLTYDVCRLWGPLFPEGLVRDGTASWRDCSRTTCEVMKDLYGAMRAAAGDDMILIGCNALNHLAAGLFELQRIGDDTSGKEWERTKGRGVNSLGFRVIQNRTFFVADADCCGLASKDAVPWEKNEQWLDLLARSGTALFVSWRRELADDVFRRALERAFRTAASCPRTGEPLDWLDTRFPRKWSFVDGTASYNW